MSAHFSSCRSRFSGYLSLLNSHLSVLPHLLRIHSHGLVCISPRAHRLRARKRLRVRFRSAAADALHGFHDIGSITFFFVPSSSWFFYIGLYDTFMIFSISKYMEEMKPCSNSSSESHCIYIFY
jgi:hypothetical protein